jgi:hypothetical protein
MTSTDGTRWSEASGTIAGWISDLISTPDGGAMAIGWVEGTPAADGGPTFDAVAWHSADGVAWTGPALIAAGATAVSAVAGGPGYLVVGWDGLGAAVWTSSDGRTWRQETVASPRGGALTSIFTVPGGYLILGDATLWFSSDARAWGLVPDMNNTGNFVATMTPTPDGVLAVGYGWDSATYHPFPRAWLASP